MTYTPCHASMAYNTTEQFRILFLDRKNILIADEVQQKGTVDHTPVYPREVVKRWISAPQASSWCTTSAVGARRTQKHAYIQWFAWLIGRPQEP